MFTFKGAHVETFCGHDQEISNSKRGISEPTSGIFLCNHAILRIYCEMVESLSTEEMHQLSTGPAPKKRKLISRAWQLLLTMPRSVRIEPTPKKFELKVSWEDAESRVISKLSSRKLKVTLHRSDVCPDKCDDLVPNEGEPGAILLFELCF